MPVRPSKPEFCDPLKNTSPPTPRLCQKRKSPLNPGNAPPESEGPLSLAAGARVVPTPNAMSIFWACARLENAARAIQPRVRTRTVRNALFKQASKFVFTGLDAELGANAADRF